MHRVLVAGAIMLLTNAAAVAQNAAGAAPGPNLSKSPPVWLGLLIMFLMLAGVIIVSLMPSKRSHQD